MEGTYMRVELPPDVADTLKAVSKALKRPPWRVIEEALKRWIIDREGEHEELPIAP